jgi:uncharacterized membrane-anchored protein YhcB (DUF1043 family)
LSWLIALIGLAVGGLAGYLLARRFGDSEQRAVALQQELDRARDDHAAYRRDVSEHFAKTAVAVNQLTESYRDVHQQLSEGARALCDNAAAETALAFDQSRLIDAPVTENPATPGAAEPVEDTPATEHAPSMAEAEPDTGKEATEQAKPTSVAATADTGDNDTGDTRALGDQDMPTPDSDAETTGENGGASWTPASSAEASEPVMPPRDYAEEETGSPTASQRH